MKHICIIIHILSWRHGWNGFIEASFLGGTFPIMESRSSLGVAFDVWLTALLIGCLDLKGQVSCTWNITSAVWHLAESSPVRSNGFWVTTADDTCAYASHISARHHRHCGFSQQELTQNGLHLFEHTADSPKICITQRSGREKNNNLWNFWCIIFMARLKGETKPCELESR